MPTITLPDGSQRSFDNAVTVADVAADIGPGLAKAALAGKVDGVLVDTSYEIGGDAELNECHGMSRRSVKAGLDCREVLFVD